MLSKITKHILALAIMMVAITGVALAQQGAVKGKVTTLENEGTQPIDGAIIDIYRVDINQKYQTKTDKKGDYFHTLPAFGQYIVSVSAAGRAAVTSPRFKIVSDQPIEQNFELAPGNGNRLTPEEVKNASAAQPPAGGAAQPSQQDVKKAQEEAAKIEAERKKIQEQNEKIKAQFEQMKKHFEAGIAFNGKQDYENAAKEFKEAVALDDTQPTIFANLAQALFNLGAVKFNAKKKDEAKESFLQSAQYGEKAAKLDPASATYQKILGDSCDILFKNFGMPEYGDKAIAAYTTGSELETDQAKKLNMINKIGAIYFTKGDFEKSNETYAKVLGIDPNNIGALKGKASIILATTVTNTTAEDKAKLEEAMSIFQQVVEKLPDGAEKTEVQGFITYLSDTMKIEVKKGGGKDNKKESKKKGK